MERNELQESGGDIPLELVDISYVGPTNPLNYIYFLVI